MITGGILRVEQSYQACCQTPLAKFIVQMPACVYQMLCNLPFETSVYGPDYVGGGGTNISGVHILRDRPLEIDQWRPVKSSEDHQRPVETIRGLYIEASIK